MLCESVSSENQDEIRTLKGSKFGLYLNEQNCWCIWSEFVSVLFVGESELWICLNWSEKYEFHLKFTEWTITSQTSELNKEVNFLELFLTILILKICLKFSLNFDERII